MTQLLNFFVSLAATFVTPFATALAPISLPLPQDINYAQTLQNQVASANFSVDPRVAAEVDAAEKNIEVFIANNQPCIKPGENLSVRLFARNNGGAPLNNIVVSLGFNPDILTLEGGTPAASASNNNSVEWNINDSLAPGNASGQEFVARFSVKAEAAALFTAVAGNTEVRSITTATMGGQCNEPASTAGGPLKNAEPVIFCDPAELGCTPSFPTLGKKFEQARENVEALTFGVRFQEAVADIVPGECRVLNDDIIVTPEFHDALNRQSRPAAPYIKPLYNSGQDYSKLANENDILGLGNFVEASGVLREANSENFSEYFDLISQHKSGGLSLEQLRGKLSSQAGTWKLRIQKAQEDLTPKYKEMQKTRRENFTDILCDQTEKEFTAQPEECQAVKNAKSSIRAACGVPADGGLLNGVIQVRNSYNTQLEIREGGYGLAQAQALGDYGEYWDNLIANTPTGGSSLQAMDALMEAYKEYKEGDSDSDNEIRLNEWEAALDDPKIVATQCQKEIDFGPRVETTFCESGEAIPVINPPGLPKKEGVVPPEIIPGGVARIQEDLVQGDICGFKPGDPFWAESCQCSCNQLVECGSQTTSEGEEPVLVLCQDCYAITKHDINISSAEECLNEPDDHFLYISDND